MIKYLGLVQDVLKNGAVRDDRTGTGTRSVFGRQIRFNLKYGFPLMTTKRLHIKSIVHELLWMLSGDTNIKYLNDNGVTIWDEWADENGELGPIYGSRWRYWEIHNECGFVDFCDQIKSVVKSIKENPFSRRHIVSTWDPTLLPDETISPQENVKNGKMALAPCHVLFQFYVDDGNLSCHLYMRSVDIFLGLPYNIASYSLLTHMIAHQCGLGVGEFIASLGDAHLYRNHITDEIVYTQLSRVPRELPILKINRLPESIFDYKFEDFEFMNYNPHPAIKAPISV